MNNQDYHVHHGQTFLTLQESLLPKFQLIWKDMADHPCIQIQNLVFSALTPGWWWAAPWLTTAESWGIASGWEMRGAGKQ